MSHVRFPRVGRFRRGYHPRQVERFLERTEASLRGEGPRVTAADVRKAGFELVNHGYVPTAVDQALDRLEEYALAGEAQLSGRRGRRDPQRDLDFLREQMSAPYLRRFPRVRTFRRGYDPDDVDDYVDRVVGVLGGDGSLDVEEVRRAVFRPRRGGYDEDAVDDLMDRVVDLLLVQRRDRADGGTPGPGRAADAGVSLPRRPTTVSARGGGPAPAPPSR